MKRDPAIHITKSRLIEVLNSIPYTSRTTGEKLAYEIFKESRPYGLNRSQDISKTKASTKKKIKRSVEADTDVPYQLVEKINMLIYTLRTKNNEYVKAKPLTRNSRDYLLLKEIAKKAHEFAEHFNIVPRQDGYETFISYGLKFMSKYSLNRFKTYENRIYESFENWVTVAEDDNKEMTDFFYHNWQQYMISQGLGDMINIEGNNDKYVHLIYARKEADKALASYEHWIEAQHEGLAFVNAIPELNQLYGINAVGRYERWIKTNHISKDSEDITSMYDEEE